MQNMTLKELIDSYHEVVKTQKEKAAVISLISELEENEDFKIISRLKAENFKLNPSYNEKLEDVFFDTLSVTKKDKQKSYERLLKIISYVNKKGFVISFEGSFKIDFLNPYERQVDLMKMLHNGKSREQIREHYKISENTLAADIDKLIDGTKILGQEVKISPVEKKNGVCLYESSLHPIFLPLNMTEVFAMTVGLKKAANKNKEFKELFENMADRIYYQLSDYGKRKIKESDAGSKIEFLESDTLAVAKNEKKMISNDLNNALLYAFKSGETCDVETSEKIYEKVRIRMPDGFENLILVDSVSGNIVDKMKTTDIKNIINLKYH